MIYWVQSIAQSRAIVPFLSTSPLPHGLWGSSIWLVGTGTIPSPVWAPGTVTSNHFEWLSPSLSSFLSSLFSRTLPWELQLPWPPGLPIPSSSQGVLWALPQLHCLYHGLETLSRWSAGAARGSPCLFPVSGITGLCCLMSSKLLFFIFVLSFLVHKGG